MSTYTAPRDLIGYGGNPPHPHWPGEARIAVNFVMNYEEGSEYNVQDDGFSEATLTEAGVSNYGVKGRDLAAEGMFEYGSRVGFWRVHRLFKERGLPLTVFGRARAGAQSEGRGGHPRVGLGRVLARLALGQALRALRVGRARAHPQGNRVDEEDGGRAPARLVLPLRAEHQHPAAGGGGGRLPLRLRRLQRRAALLGAGRPHPAPGGAVQPHRERLQVRQRRLLHRERLLHVRER